MSARQARSQGVCPPPVSTPLPCQRHPDRWFDPTNRSHALANCLHCPARRWCARVALREKPSWGMWAGIWIDGRLDDTTTGYLRAIADQSPAAQSTVADVRSLRPAPVVARTPPAIGVGNRRTAAISTTTRPPSVRAAVIARSGGYCELMAPGCQYNSIGLKCRIPGTAAADADSPAVVYDRCRACDISLEALDLPITRALGYIIDDGQDPAAIPFFWRQSRWMLLDSAGGTQHAVA